MQEKSFWEKVESRSPQLLKDLIAYLKNISDKLKGTVGNLASTSELFKTKESLDRAINIATDVVAQVGARETLAKKNGIEKVTKPTETSESYKEKYADKKGWVTVRVLDPTQKQGTLKRKPYILKTQPLAVLHSLSKI